MCECDTVNTQTRLWVERVIGISVVALPPVVVRATGGLRALDREAAARQPDASWWAIFMGTEWLWWATAAVSGLIAALWGWHNSRGTDDLRYLDLPPGVVPPLHQPLRVGRDDHRAVPVRFSPPEVSLPEAGLLLHGSSQPPHLAAVIVQLATAGALRHIPATETTPARVEVVDPRRCPDRGSAEVFAALFARGPRCELTGDALLDAFGVVADQASLRAQREAWLRGSVPRKGRRRGPVMAARARQWAGQEEYARASIGVEGATWAVFTFLALLVCLLVMIFPPLSVPVGAVVGFFVFAAVAPPIRTWSRSARATAYADQIAGFRRYLITAEAGQLRGVNADQVYARCLPWAVLFGVADRWRAICEHSITRDMALWCEPFADEVSAWAPDLEDEGA